MFGKIKYFVSGLVVGLLMVGGVSFADESFFKLTKMDCKIVANGKEINMDLPILNHEGRSYLPLRSIADITGDKIEWNSDTKTINLDNKVNIEYKEVIKEIPKETIKEIPKEIIKIKYVEDTKKIEKLKDITLIMDAYFNLSIATTDIRRARDTVSLFCDQILRKTEYVNNFNEYSLSDINKAVESYNIVIKQMPLYKSTASKNGFDISDMDKINISQNNCINYIKEAYKKIAEYSSYNISDDFNSYIKNMDYYRNENLYPDSSYNMYFKYSNMITPIANEKTF